MRMKSRPHVKPEDLLYHEELGALMTSVHLARHKRSKEYRYGAVSFLKLLDEGKIPTPPDPGVQLDLDVYREALRRHRALLAGG